jgi:hypothetical protein
MTEDRQAEAVALAHELWAMSQGVAPVDEVVSRMVPELLAFAGVVLATEREAGSNAGGKSAELRVRRLVPRRKEAA